MKHKNSSRKRFKGNDLWIIYLVPTFGIWISWIYFGQNYTDSPAEGYGLGLATTSLMAIALAGWFLWKYRRPNGKKSLDSRPGKP